MLSSIIGQVAVLAALAVATVAPIMIVLSLVGVAVDPVPWVLVAALAFAFGCVIAAACTLLATLTLSRSLAGGAVAGVLLLMYLTQTVSKMVDGVPLLSSLSLFAYFSPAGILDRGAIPFGDFVILGGLAVGAGLAPSSPSGDAPSSPRRAFGDRRRAGGDPPKTAPSVPGTGPAAKGPGRERRVAPPRRHPEAQGRGRTGGPAPGFVITYPWAPSIAWPTVARTRPGSPADVERRT